MCVLFSDVHIPYQVPEMSGLYKGLNVFNFDFLPSTPALINGWISQSPKNNSSRLLIFETQVAQDTSSLFLDSIGSIISFFLILFLVYPIILVLSWKIGLFMKIRSYFEWNGFFTIILFVYYAIMRAAFLQLKDVTIIFNG